MTPRTRPGSVELGQAIRARREQLGLTIDEAAARSGLGRETLRRYESGSAIREDKIPALCRLLAWQRLPDAVDQSDAGGPLAPNWDDRDRAGFSESVEDALGEDCAHTLAVGFELVVDQIDHVIAELESMPLGSHVGMTTLGFEFDPPPVFLTRCDHQTMVRLRNSAADLSRRLQEPLDLPLEGLPVAEQIVLRRSLEAGQLYVETVEMTEPDDSEDWREWFGGLVGDADLGFMLYGGGIEIALEPTSKFHIDNWFTNSGTGTASVEVQD